ncbi:Phosphoribosylaminoimidazole carboxylase catalytic subunit [Crocosphaera watsonii WH 0005]|uniref:Phosphoribosylaminoimidazole carboxylase catalytic subunit n=1 Tax=Crocosphaera watsonii WH 0005 TaxID=423472 RepID=T2IV05_CROWT|nr:Phosphoribosylaminoimidazole carboxylase catalytic subunit [Crocosphaera watsonii WH 0005]
MATVAIGNAQNAGLLAIQMLAAHDPILLKKVQNYRQELEQMVLDKQENLDKLGYEAYLKQM